MTAEQKRTLATVNALLGNVFLTSDMPSRYTQAQRAEYRRLRDIFEHAEQVKVKTEEGAVCIHYLLYGRPQKLLCSPFLESNRIYACIIILYKRRKRLILEEKRIAS